MTNEKALQIARYFLRQWRDIEPAKIYIKKQAPAGGPITILAEIIDEEGEQRIYEVEMDTTCNAIVAKEVLAAASLADYQAKPRMLSTLKPGDRFRLQFDCVVYEYHRLMEVFGQKLHSIFRADRDSCSSQIQETIVYPLGK